MIINLCDRFKKLPSEVRAEPAELLIMLQMIDIGTPKTDEGGVEFDG